MKKVGFSVIFMRKSCFCSRYRGGDNMISFIVFIVMVAILGVGVSLKLLRQDREVLALLYGWISIGLVAMTLITYIHLTRFI